MFYFSSGFSSGGGWSVGIDVSFVEIPLAEVSPMDVALAEVSRFIGADVAIVRFIVQIGFALPFF